MPNKPSINISDRFGKLTVIAFIGIINKQRWWKCVCECGRTVERTTGQLRRLQSCGCLRGKNGIKHGMSESTEFTIWHTMKARCYNPNATGYERYGGIGVTVFEEWIHDFMAFYNYVGPRPSLRHSIDRWPNKKGNYEPGNVRWGTWEDQGRNKQNNHLLTLNGVTRVLTEWGEITGLGWSTLLNRKRMGWTDDESLTIPVMKKGQRRHAGTSKSAVRERKRKGL